LGEHNGRRIDNIVTLRTGGDDAVMEARKAIATALSRAPHAGVERVRAAIDAVSLEELKDPEARAILGQLAALVDRLALIDASDEVCWQVIAAANSLKVNGGSAFARELIKRVNFQLANSAPIFVVLRGMLVSLGVVVLLGLMAFLLIAVGEYNYNNAAEMPFLEAVWNTWVAAQSNLIIVAAAFGILGAIVSILLSVAQYDLVRRSDQFLLVSGGVLPIVGAILAMVACAFFESGLISTTVITENEANKVFFYIVLGFVAGFSERFVRGLLLVFEKRYENGNDANGSSSNGQHQVGVQTETNAQPPSPPAR
jgi:hypothetical protein